MVVSSRAASEISALPGAPKKTLADTRGLTVPFFRLTQGQGKGAQDSPGALKPFQIGPLGIKHLCKSG